MNNYITLDGKKYVTPNKFWTPYADKPATVKQTLMGGVDVTYGPAVFTEWHGQIEAPVTPIDDGARQVETATAVGTIVGSGMANITVTAAGMTGSPKLYTVAVFPGQISSAWASTVRSALAADSALTALYAVGGSGSTITLTSKLLTAGNDSTLNIAIANGTCTGITAAPLAVNTTTGLATSWGSITDLRATCSKLNAVSFTDHYGTVTNVHVLGPFQERSLSPKWDAGSNKILVTVRLVKA